MLENPLRKKLKEVPFVGTFNRLAPYEELGTRERYVPLETKTKPFTPPQPRGLEVFSELVSMELEETQKFMTQYPHRSFWKNEEGDDDAILKALRDQVSPERSRSKRSSKRDILGAGAGASVGHKGRGFAVLGFD